MGEGGYIVSTLNSLLVFATVKGLTSANALRISLSFSSPTSKHKILPESMTSGMTLAMIRAAMNKLAIGSKPVQPVKRMRIVEMMTPTLPSVSYSCH